MNKETISKVANVLNAWNPLGEKAKTITDLDGYRIEAIDILSTINIMKEQNKIEKTIKQVISQAFHIEVNDSEASKAAKEIKQILENEK